MCNEILTLDSQAAREVDQEVLMFDGCIFTGFVSVLFGRKFWFDT